MQGQQRINISEQKPAKFIELADGYEVLSNDSTIKIILRPVTIMDGSMESGFYATTMSIKEGDGWIAVNNTKNYGSKEEFIKDIIGSEDFTQAVMEYQQSLTIKKQ